MSRNIKTQLKSRDVMVIGDALIDHQYWVEKLPAAGGDEKISASQSSTGGSAANTAFALCFGGASCIFCGRVGSDESGRDLLRRMKQAGVDVSCAAQGGETGYTLTVIDATGERTMMSFRGASGQPVEMTDTVRSKLSQAGALMLSGYYLSDARQAAFALEAAKLASAAGAMVALDPSPVIGRADEDILHEILGVTDVILPNRSEMRQMAQTDDVLQAAKTLGVPCVVMKDGAAGSTMALGKGFAFCEAAGVFSAAAQARDAVDTTGAGDAFAAGFLTALTAGSPPRQWLESGNEMAAAVILSRGAATAYTKE